MKALASLISSFAAMLDPDPGNEEKLQQWISDAQAWPRLRPVNMEPVLRDDF